MEEDEIGGTWRMHGGHKKGLQNLVGKLEKTRTPGRLKRRWQNNIKMGS
jgi:hypothetical protein